MFMRNEKEKEYVYLTHFIKLGRGIQTLEIERMIGMTWAATENNLNGIKEHGNPNQSQEKHFSFLHFIK